MDFPALTQLEAAPVLGTMSMWSFGGIQATGTSVGAQTSGAWPSANLGIFIPLTLPAPFPLRAGWTRNGSAVAGNMDIGVYALDGTLIASTGSTAQSGTSTFQIVSISEKLLQPGSYYIALSCSSTSAQFIRDTFVAGAGQRIGGILQAASQVPLTTLPTFALPANDYVPIFGIASVASF